MELNNFRMEKEEFGVALKEISEAFSHKKKTSRLPDTNKLKLIRMLDELTSEPGSSIRQEDCLDVPDKVRVKSRNIMDFRTKRVGPRNSQIVALTQARRQFHNNHKKEVKLQRSVNRHLKEIGHARSCTSIETRHGPTTEFVVDVPVSVGTKLRGNFSIHNEQLQLNKTVIVDVLYLLRDLWTMGWYRDPKLLVNTKSFGKYSTLWSCVKQGVFPTFWQLERDEDFSSFPKVAPYEKELVSLLHHTFPRMVCEYTGWAPYNLGCSLEVKEMELLISFRNENSTLMTKRSPPGRGKRSKKEDIVISQSLGDMLLSDETIKKFSTKAVAGVAEAIQEQEVMKTFAEALAKHMDDTPAMRGLTTMFQTIVGYFEKISGWLGSTWLKALLIIAVLLLVYKFFSKSYSLITGLCRFIMRLCGTDTDANVDLVEELVVKAVKESKDSVQAQSFGSVSGAWLVSAVAITGTMLAGGKGDVSTLATMMRGMQSSTSVFDTLFSNLKLIVNGICYFVTGNDLFSDIVEQKRFGELMEEICSQMAEPDFSTQLGRSKLKCEKVLRQYSEAHGLFLKVSGTKNIPTDTKNFYRQALSQLKEYRDVAIGQMSMMRKKIDPVVFYACGEPNQGKSSAISLVCAGVYKKMRDEFPEDPQLREPWNGSQLWGAPSGTDFWDGYKNQFGLMLDDILAESDPKLRAAEARQLYKIVSPIPLNLNMARIEDKGVTYLDSKFIALTSNIKLGEDAIALTDPGAFFRRIHFPVTVTMKNRVDLATATAKDLESAWTFEYKQIPGKSDDSYGDPCLLEGMFSQDTQYTLSEITQLIYRVMRFRYLSQTPMEVSVRLFGEMSGANELDGSRTALTEKIIAEARKALAKMSARCQKSGTKVMKIIYDLQLRFLSLWAAAEDACKKEILNPLTAKSQELKEVLARIWYITGLVTTMDIKIQNAYDDAIAKIDKWFSLVCKFFREISESVKQKFEVIWNEAVGRFDVKDELASSYFQKLCNMIRPEPKSEKLSPLAVEEEKLMEELILDLDKIPYDKREKARETVTGPMVTSSLFFEDPEFSLDSDSGTEIRMNDDVESQGFMDTVWNAIFWRQHPGLQDLSLTGYDVDAEVNSAQEFSSSATLPTPVVTTFEQPLTLPVMEQYQNVEPKALKVLKTHQHKAFPLTVQAVAEKKEAEGVLRTIDERFLEALRNDTKFDAKQAISEASDLLQPDVVLEQIDRKVEEILKEIPLERLVAEQQAMENRVKFHRDFATVDTNLEVLEVPEWWDQLMPLGFKDKMVQPVSGKLFLEALQSRPGCLKDFVVCCMTCPSMVEGAFPPQVMAMLYTACVVSRHQFSYMSTMAWKNLWEYAGLLAQVTGDNQLMIFTGVSRIASENTNLYKAAVTDRILLTKDRIKTIVAPQMIETIHSLLADALKATYDAYVSQNVEGNKTFGARAAAQARFSCYKAKLFARRCQSWVSCLSSWRWQSVAAFMGWGVIAASLTMGIWGIVSYALGVPEAKAQSLDIEDLNRMLSSGEITNKQYDVLRNKILKINPELVTTLTVDAQGGIVNSEMVGAYNKLSSAMRWLSLHDADNKSVFTRCFMLSDHAIVIPRHVYADWKITKFTLHPDGNLKTGVTITDFSTVDKFAGIERDLAILVVNKSQLQNIQSMTSFFSDDLAPPGTEVLRIHKETGVEANKTIIHVVGPKPCSLSTERRQTKAANGHTAKLEPKHHYLAAGLGGRSGDCILPYVSVEGTKLTIRGFHVGCIGSDVAVFTPLLLSEIDKYCKGLNPSADVIVSHCLPLDSVPVLPGAVAVTKLGKKYKIVSETEFVPTLFNFKQIVSEGDVKVLPPIGGQKVAPARLVPFKNSEGVTISPLDKASLKYDRCFQRPPMSLDPLVEEAWPEIREFAMVNTQCTPLTQEEAIFGGRNGQVDSLNDSKSPGYPYVLEGVKRRDLFCVETRFISENFRADVTKILQTADTQVPVCVYCEQLKDELRDMDRVREGKTRIFDMSPVDICVALKMTVGDWVTKAKKKWIYGASAVGVSPTGIDWTVLFSFVNQHPNHIGADCGGYDMSLIVWLMDLFIRLVCESYPKEFHAKIGNMCRTLLAPYILRGDVIYQRMAGNASGNWLTSTFNSFCMYAIHVLCFYKNRPTKAFTFRQNVALVVYGDDNYGSVSNAAAWFNMLVLRDFFKDYFNMEYTTPGKGEVTAPWLPVDERVFLSRRFNNLHGRTRAPLELDSILGMLHWVRNPSGPQRLLGVTANDQLKVNMDTAARELVQHGRETYELVGSWIQERIRQVPEAAFLSPVWQSYDYWNGEVMSTF